MAKSEYADAEYQALSEYRCTGTHLKFLSMVRGVPPRQ
jgi:hypothetical protein